MRSSAAWSAGVSTTHSWRASRAGVEADRGTPSASVKVWQRSQWRTLRDRRLQRARDAQRAVAVVLQQVEGHALRRLHADAGQAAQRLDQRVERRLSHARDRRGAQNGNFMPGGSGMPAVSLPIFSWLTSSARRTRVVEGGGDQVLEHVLVVGEQARVDG